MLCSLVIGNYRLIHRKIRSLGNVGFGGRMPVEGWLGEMYRKMRWGVFGEIKKGG